MTLNYDTDKYDVGRFKTTTPSLRTLVSHIISAPEIRICDENYIPRIVLDGFKNLTYTERHRNRDSWSFEISRESEDAEYLIKGRIIHYVTGTSVYALIIKQVDATRDTITVSGNEYADDLLSARIALVNVQVGAGAGSISTSRGTGSSGGGNGATHNLSNGLVVTVGSSGAANTGGGGGGGDAAGGGYSGGSGVVIIKFPDNYSLTVSAGLTYSDTTIGVYKIYTFTAGTGTVSFS